MLTHKTLMVKSMSPCELTLEKEGLQEKPQ